jgi:hypothetical protein
MSIIYHASTNKNLVIIFPKRTFSKDKYIGNFVFGTTDKILATMYLATRGYSTLMNSRGEQPNIVICAVPAEYQLGDSGGAIYELPVESFIESPQKELSDYELVSKRPVKPLNKLVYNSSLEAMRKAGIIVRFVDEHIFNDLVNNPDQAKLISRLPTFDT